ncbi:MAG: hypothetical protein Q4D62_11625 [Planctomycetia bacterium]|nr:hypothetical protein [Planctomycetia bacterium]
MIRWSAREGDLIVPHSPVESWNFHPLPSGNFCVSRTFRLEKQMFTHGLVIPPQLLDHYANNPFSLIFHLEQQGLWSAGREVTSLLLHRTTPTTPGKVPVMRTLTVEGGCPPVHEERVRQEVQKWGTRRLVTFLDTLLKNVSTIVFGQEKITSLLEVLFDLLPVGCRTEISFSTGLKFSTRRPFRIVGIGEDLLERERIATSFQIPIFSLREIPSPENRFSPPLRNRWAMFMAAVLEQQRERQWSEKAILDKTSSLAALPKLARQYFKELGLATLYRKIRSPQSLKKIDTESLYCVVESSHPTLSEAKKSIAALSPEGKKADSRTTRLDAPTLTAYLATVSEAVHGNPLANEHLHDTFRNLTQSVRAEEREEVCDFLLTRGIQCWSEQHDNILHQSCRLVENRIDTLSTMLELWCEGKELVPLKKEVRETLKEGMDS